VEVQDKMRIWEEDRKGFINKVMETSSFGIVEDFRDFGMTMNS
jgi:hypothetical protein